MINTYIQHNQIVSELDDGIGIEVSYYVRNHGSDTYESHGLHTITDSEIIVKYADMVIVEKGKIVSRGELSDTEQVRLFLIKNL